MTVIADTSYLFSLANRRDRFHTHCLAFAQTLQERLVIPVTVLPEISYLLDSRLGHHVMRRFVEQLTLPETNVEPLQDADLARTQRLLHQYADARLDFVDATLIAMAERLNVQRILTLDHRHFQLVRPAHCTAFTLLPALD